MRCPTGITGLRLLPPGGGQKRRQRHRPGGAEHENQPHRRLTCDVRVAMPIDHLMSAVSSLNPPGATPTRGGSPAEIERPHPCEARTSGTPSIIMSPDLVRGPR